MSNRDASDYKRYVNAATIGLLAHKKGLTIAKLAEELGTPYRHLWRVLGNQHPRSKLILDMAELFDVPVAALGGEASVLIEYGSKKVKV